VPFWPPRQGSRCFRSRVKPEIGFAIVEFDAHGFDSPPLRSLYPSSKTASIFQTLDFYLVSEKDLLAKTEWFTADATIDADHYVGGSPGVPEPASGALLALGLPGSAVARRRARVGRPRAGRVPARQGSDGRTARPGRIRLRSCTGRRSP